MSESLVKRYDERIAGVLSCYDRVVITGTLPGVCYAEGMTRFLHANGVRIFDYPQFAMTLRDQIALTARHHLAAQAGVTIEHIGKAHIRKKEDVVAQVLEQRGDRPGRFTSFRRWEACNAYQPWHDKKTPQDRFVRPDSGKCLHYYFLALPGRQVQVGLPAGPYLERPFLLQFYCNGHSWLARKLSAKGIGYTAADNAFVRIDDWAPRARNWRIPSRPTNCTARWIAMPRSAARCLTRSGSPTTGA